MIKDMYTSCDCVAVLSPVMSHQETMPVGQ